MGFESKAKTVEVFVEKLTFDFAFFSCLILLLTPAIDRSDSVTREDFTRLFFSL